MACNWCVLQDQFIIENFHSCKILFASYLFTVFGSYTAWKQVIRPTESTLTHVLVLSDTLGMIYRSRITYKSARLWNLGGIWSTGRKPTLSQGECTNSIQTAPKVSGTLRQQLYHCFSISCILFSFTFNLCRM